MFNDGETRDSTKPHSANGALPQARIRRALHRVSSPTPLGMPIQGLAADRNQREQLSDPWDRVPGQGVGPSPKRT